MYFCFLNPSGIRKVLNIQITDKYTKGDFEEGPRSGTNEFKQSYWSKALNWSQCL